MGCFVDSHFHSFEKFLTPIVPSPQIEILVDVEPVMFTFEEIEDGILDDFEVFVGVLGQEGEKNLNSINGRVTFDDLNNLLIDGLFHNVKFELFIKKTL